MALFYDSDDERFLNRDLLHIVRQELYAISASNTFTRAQSHIRIPSHTEDGIPIRKLYVSNLPPKTTRSELFEVFAQYGFIKSCWLRIGEKDPNRIPTPTYAFVTYGDPADARRALGAPIHEKTIRGRCLKIYPADSWHQPAEDSNGRVHWKNRGERQLASPTFAPEAEPEHSVTENLIANRNTENNSNLEEVSATSDSYSIMDILNMDCLSHILSYVPIVDIIRSERVSKKWKDIVQEYFNSIRTFKTSCWQSRKVKLTTAVLRHVLQRFGISLIRLHIDHHWSALNDRTAHTVGKFCPNLEEVKVTGMNTKNWNPLIYGCKQLKTISFISCNKLTDASLVLVIKSNTGVENLAVANNTHVTGLFLTQASQPSKITGLSFYNCYSLQGTVLSAAMDTLPCLTSLKLDVCPISMWKMIPTILGKLPQLEELSLTEYMSVDLGHLPIGIEDFCESLALLPELKHLNLSRNIYITNAVLKQVSQSCTKLESLNISSCNSRKNFVHTGVNDESILAVCSNCTLLTYLDVSYLAGITDTGLAAAAKLKRLVKLISRGNATISAAPLSQILHNCHYLDEIDVCGCDGVTEEVISSAVKALETHPRSVILRLAGTPAGCVDNGTYPQDYPSHKLLSINLYEDRSNPHMRPDFTDRIYESSSEISFEDEHEEFDIENDYLGHMLSSDDEFVDEDFPDYNDIFEFGLHNIIIL